MSRGLFTLMALATLAGCTASVSPTPPISRLKQAGGETTEFFVPKTPLEDFRFVYHWETGLFMELGNEQSALLEEFLARFPNVEPDTYVPFSKEGSRLNREHHQFLAQRIPETLGNRYCVYFPDQITAATYRTSEFALKPTGDGRFRGFLAKLAPVREESPSPTPLPRENWRGALSLAFRSDATASKPRPMSDGVTDRKVLDDVAMELGKIDELRDQEVYACRQFFLKYPGSIGYLAEVRGEIGWPFSEKSSVREETFHPSYLFCLVPVGGELRVMPFPLETMFPGESFGGIMIEVADYPAYDLSPGDTKIHVLPDLDGDSSCELLIDTTVMQLFRFVQEDNVSGNSNGWTIQLVKDSYFGP